MSKSYEQSFRKIAPVEDLPDGKPKVFRAAGATIVLLRRGNALEAIDGSCVSDDTDMPEQRRIARILDCVSAAVVDGRSGAPDGQAGSPVRQESWQSLVTKAGLAARVEDGWAWVCLDGCKLD